LGGASCVRLQTAIPPRIKPATTKETWCEADVRRIAAEIAVLSQEPDAPKAEAYFERALTIARQQQAKSWNCAPR
jgi:hypothetical protein